MSETPADYKARRTQSLNNLIAKDDMNRERLKEMKYNDNEILEVLIANASSKSLQHIIQFGYTQDDILNVFISRNMPLEDIFKSRFQFTYGYLKKNIEKFDKSIQDSFKAFSKNIEGPDKCISKLGSSKAACYYDSYAKKYISKGGRKRRSHRNQYRRSRKISKK